MNGLTSTVFNKFHKIIVYAIFPAVLITLLPDLAVSQYRVSGVVEFTYHGLTTQTGNAKASDYYWTQYYRTNVQGDVFDPRFLRFSGGVGYAINTYKNGPDTDALEYNINTSFFPGMKLAWDLFGSNSVQNVESDTNIAGYDMTTESYGGTLKLNLGRSGKSRNRRRNNNNNGDSFLLPDITLSRIHTETESLSSTAPLSETRDDTRASINYWFNKNFDLNLDGTAERYENLIGGSSYDTKTVDMLSTIWVAPDAELKLEGHVTDTLTENITGYAADETTLNYRMHLDFKEKNGFRHYYRYNFDKRQDVSSEQTTHRAEARLIYDITEELELRGGLDYTLSYYTLAPGPLPTDLGNDQTDINGGLNAGLRYDKKYSSPLLGPFVIETAYAFGYGFTDVSDEIDPSNDGRGPFYTNEANLGLRSAGWRRDNLVISYSFSNKRDDSPVNNDMWQHSYRLVLDTRRVPRTQIRGTASYTSLDSSYEESVKTTQTQQGLNEKRRSYLYDLTVDHRVSSYVSLTAGATRGQDTSTYTLSSLATAVTEDDLYYALANIFYPITRRLRYRAQLREELRMTQTTDTRNHQVLMYLDYRIRRIFVKFEYRWRQDIPENSARSAQSYYYAKLSRPF